MSTNESEKDEPKTERFNMFMSPSEMKAIDDWAWEKRIRSKSEAVRRLIQIGLRVEGSLNEIAQRVYDGSARYQNLVAEYDAILDDEMVTGEYEAFLLRQLMHDKVINDLRMRHFDINNRVVELASELNEVLRVKDIQLAIAEADKIKAKAIEKSHDPELDYGSFLKAKEKAKEEERKDDDK